MSPMYWLVLSFMFYFSWVLSVPVLHFCINEKMEKLGSEGVFNLVLW